MSPVIPIDTVPDPPKPDWFTEEAVPPGSNPPDDDSDGSGASWYSTFRQMATVPVPPDGDESPQGPVDDHEYD
jgi:hypothetical protein